MKWKTLSALIAFLVLSGTIAACKTGTSPSTTPASTTPPPTFSLPDLKYRILAAYPDFFWCDPDFYPISRPGVEQQNAADQFATIRADQSEFSAILAHLGLPNKTDYTDDEKLQIYREHKKLNRALETAAVSGGYTFTVRTGQNQGKQIQGTITYAGAIKVTSETASFNTCPICLAAGTLIGTPDGDVAVENLVVGSRVWTFVAGYKTEARIVKVDSTQAPASFQVMTVKLADGRSVTASPGHPTADGRTLGELKAGDMLDNSNVVSASLSDYTGRTYDLLPDGPSGLYLANGIRLQSTLTATEVWDCCQ